MYPRGVVWHAVPSTIASQSGKEYARARVADMPKAAQPRMQALSVSDSRSSIQAL